MARRRFTVDRYTEIERRLVGRIASIADVFDALTSSRPYRLKPFSLEETFRIIEEGRGADFDPGIVDAFVSIRPNRVRVDNTGSSFYTIIEVFSYDFKGLLYKVTDAIHRLGLNIAVAKIATKVDQVVDVFYVRDLNGQKIIAPDQVALIEILTKPKNALVRQYQKLFEYENVKLRFTDDALEAIAEAALRRKIGARGLRMIIEDLMLELMYALPGQKKVRECVITREVVDHQAPAMTVIEKAG